MEDKFDIINFLRSAVATKASDEHLRVGFAPFIRKNGFVKRTNLTALSTEDIENAVVQIAPAILKDTVLGMTDVDFRFEIKGCSCFRVNYSRQMGEPAIVIRNIPYAIPSFEKLGLPEVLDNIIKSQNGIVLVTGPTGSGKSTTLASIINKISMDEAKHIVTIEDPVEYIFHSQKSIVSQRQVGVDTDTFLNGVKYALRQDPDVILIGEIRDRETMDAALKAAETGHLVLTTLHTNDAVQTINRIINMFEESHRDLIRKQLAESLRATIAQQLVYSEEQQKRFLACEVMVANPAVKDYIKKDNLDEIYNLLTSNNYDNMISLNTSLANLVLRNLVSEKEALKKAQINFNSIFHLIQYLNIIITACNQYLN